MAHKENPLDGQGARAATSSDLTHSSGSTDEREASASLASAEPTRPSAQAACPRTNGSGSESAEASTETASGVRWYEASADYATEARIPDKLLFDAWEVLDPA